MSPELGVQCLANAEDSPAIQLGWWVRGGQSTPTANWNALHFQHCKNSLFHELTFGGFSPGDFVHVLLFSLEIEAIRFSCLPKQVENWRTGM